MGEAKRQGEEFGARFESAFARLQVTILEACGREGNWPRKVAAGLTAGMRFAAADPDAARTLTGEALAHGREGVARRDRLVAYLGERLEAGRGESPDGQRLPDSTEQAIAGGLLGLVEQRIDLGRAAELPGIASEAIQFALTPYMGRDEARRVAAEYGAPGGKA